MSCERLMEMPVIAGYGDKEVACICQLALYPGPLYLRLSGISELVLFDFENICFVITISSFLLGDSAFGSPQL